MQSVLFVFAAILSFVSAQCYVTETTFTAGNNTLAFGAAVGDKIPAIHHFDDYGVVSIRFLTFVRATSARWDIEYVGFKGRAVEECVGVVGHLGFTFSSDCSSVVISTIYDDCVPRANIFSDGVTFTKQAVVAGACPAWSGVLQETSDSPRLSGEPFTIYSAPEDIKILSVSDKAIIFQQWSKGSDDPVNLYRWQDLFSIPAAYACEERFFGQYYVTKQFGCGATLCGKADACSARGHLFHGIALNGFANAVTCDADIDILQYSNSACSTGEPWTKSATDCTHQFNGDQCMWCNGMTNGHSVALCLERNGGICEDIQNSPQAHGWCNLQLVCPA